MTNFAAIIASLSVDTSRFQINNPEQHADFHEAADTYELVNEFQGFNLFEATMPDGKRFAVFQINETTESIVLPLEPAPVETDPARTIG